MTTADDPPLEVDCERHGKGVVAVVCGHLLGEQEDPLGFVENSSVPGDYQGWCARCEALFLEEESMTEAFKAFTRMSIVCEACYFGIRARHTHPPRA